jgi:hypothetical protein
VFFGVGGEHEGKSEPRRKKSGSKAPALHMEFSTGSIIPVDSRTSRKTLGKTCGETGGGVEWEGEKRGDGQIGGEEVKSRSV